jgi:hypothetical protein
MTRGIITGMQPENVNFQPERTSRGAENPNFGHNGLENGPESLPTVNLENESNASHERSVVESIVSSGPLVTSIPAPTLPGASASNPILADVPLTAADDDIIESRWIEEAKKIVEHTKGDPHAQGDATYALKSDYLLKRHNRTIGSLDEAS